MTSQDRFQRGIACKVAHALRPPWQHDGIEVLIVTDVIDHHIGQYPCSPGTHDHITITGYNHVATSSPQYVDDGHGFEFFGTV
jgi:hypothetical protein